MSTQPNYEAIFKHDKMIDDNIALLKQAIAEIEKTIQTNRAKRMTAMQAEQSLEASKLEGISQQIRNFLVPNDQSQPQPQPQPPQQYAHNPQFAPTAPPPPPQSQNPYQV